MPPAFPWACPDLEQGQNAATLLAVRLQPEGWVVHRNEGKTERVTGPEREGKRPTVLSVNQLRNFVLDFRGR